MKTNSTKVMGSHSFRAGTDFRQHFRTQIQNGVFTSGNFTFANTYVRKGEDGQDTWRFTRNRTLTLSLRMEYERGATERYNRALSCFDPN